MPHPEHPDWYEVRFTAKALEDWGITWPHAPPGDEVVLWMEPGPCAECGGPHQGGFGAIDPDHVTQEGLLVGRQICQSCLENGK